MTTSTLERTLDPATERPLAASAPPARSAALPSVPWAPALAKGVRRTIALAAFLLLWELGPRYLLEPGVRVFLPPLHEVLQALVDLVVTGQLQQHLSASLSRSALGFTAAVTGGVTLGLVIAWYATLREVLTPLLELFRNTAALALLPVFTLLLGIGELSKVSIVAFAAFFPVLLLSLIHI